MLVNYFLSWITLLSVFQTSDIPVFKGGRKSLDSFISNSIIYPEYSKFNCLQGTIYVSFKLNKNGKIYSSAVEQGMGLDLDEEALRVVRLTSGKWIVPASFDTTQALVLPVNFTLKEYNCEAKSREVIKEAIAAYKTREELTNAVTNYYRRKAGGKSDPGEEQQILQIKAQLGYDEGYFNRLIKEGQQKLKQGDKESACDNFLFVRDLGSDKADKLIDANCKK